jgi:hypothetical protein
VQVLARAGKVTASRFASASPAPMPPWANRTKERAPS